MSLKNISKESITLKHNGKELAVKPGAEINAADFGVSAADSATTEAFLAGKTPGLQAIKGRTFEQVKAEMQAKVDALEAEKAELIDQLAKAEKRIEKLEKKAEK